MFHRKLEKFSWKEKWALTWVTIMSPVDNIRQFTAGAKCWDMVCKCHKQLRIGDLELRLMEGQLKTFRRWDLSPCPKFPGDNTGHSVITHWAHPGPFAVGQWGFCALRENFWHHRYMQGRQREGRNSNRSYTNDTRTDIVWDRSAN